MQSINIGCIFSCLKSIFIIPLFILSFPGWAQQLFWNQAQVYITEGALLHVNGNLESTFPGTYFSNQGRVRTENGYQNGDFVLSDSALIQGDGRYELQGDWLNSASFIADSSLVLLEGNNEFIGGDSISYFFDLELMGSGIKTLLIDAFTTNELGINDRELAIDSFHMTITNPSIDAVTNDDTFFAEGFASTLLGGRLVRHINQDSSYTFPMGSSQGTLRYRPVVLALNDTSTNIFSVGFNNYNATADGYTVSNHDSTVCRINDLYYHLIEHSLGTSSSNLHLYYHGTDGHFDEIAQWDTAASGMWNAIGRDSALLIGYHVIVVDSVHNYDPFQFALATMTPPAPEIAGDTIVCDPDLLWTYDAIPSNMGSVYVWDVPSDALIDFGAGSSSIDVDWLSSGGGSITVYEIDSNGCESFPGGLNVNLFPGLLAEFDTTGNPLYGSFEFANYSTDADDYFWDFGDGNSSTLENPVHNYDYPGLYQVVLTAMNSFGCESKDTLILEVVEGIDIPNVFTPNGDGENDVFFANSIGMTDKSISVFNRWGKEIYFSSKLDFAWDGSNIWTGQPVPEGTYFYVIKARSVTREYEYSGALMLHR